MNVIKCESCDFLFYTDAEWKKSCLHCYKESNGMRILQGDEQMRLLQALIYDFGITLEVAQTGDINETPLDGVQERLRDLLLLCHPDKHRDSVKATEVTKWLLSLRGKL